VARHSICKFLLDNGTTIPKDPRVTPQAPAIAKWNEHDCATSNVDSHRQLHPQVHVNPSIGPALSTIDRSHTIQYPRSQRKPQPAFFCDRDRYFSSFSLPLQATSKSGVVNFKWFGNRGLRGGGSGQTWFNTRAITGENAI
jgi:hypothetical protein